MKRFLVAALLAGIGSLAFATTPARAFTQHVWMVTSPDHGQTFTYGTEQRRSWTALGRDHHLALYLDYTNDPYVGWNEPRQYDYFTIEFPTIKLGPDGHTFYFHTSDGRSLPVATRKAGFLGIPEVKLLPSSHLTIRKPHGYLTVTLMIEDQFLAKELQ